MHEAASVALPAGKPVELKPGGYHLMLMGVERTLGAGDRIPFNLTIADRNGKKTRIEVKADVRPLGQ
jgi:copper(I)-binding protein